MKIFSFTYLNVLFGARLKQFFNRLPFFRYNNYNTFLIIGHPRTGTSLLHTYLNSHDAVLSLNEPLAHSNDGKALFKAYSRFIKVVGFKYFYEYVLDIEKKNVLIQLIADHKIKVIKIHRLNYLRTYVSLCIAEKTNEWSSTGNVAMDLLNKQIYLTKEECLFAFAQYKNVELETDKILAQYHVPVYGITYESLVSDPISVMEGVELFLGVEPQIPVSLLVRQNPENMSELIVNYEELKTSFLKTEFEVYFED